MKSRTDRPWASIDKILMWVFLAGLIFGAGAITNGVTYGVGFLPWLWNNTHKLASMQPSAPSHRIVTAQPDAGVTCPPPDELGRRDPAP